MAARTRIDLREAQDKLDAAMAIMDRLEGVKVTNELRNDPVAAQASRDLLAVAHQLEFARVLVLDEYHSYRSAVATVRRRGADDG